MDALREMLATMGDAAPFYAKNGAFENLSRRIAAEFLWPPGATIRKMAEVALQKRASEELLELAPKFSRSTEKQRRLAIEAAGEVGILAKERGADDVRAAAAEILMAVQTANRGGVSSSEIQAFDKLVVIASRSEKVSVSEIVKIYEAGRPDIEWARFANVGMNFGMG
jgi:hypothetical protein